MNNLTRALKKFQGGNMDVVKLAGRKDMVLYKKD